MPKKQKRAFTNLKAFQGTSSSTGKNEQQPTTSVNQRLEGLRKLEARGAAQKKREFAEAVSQRCVPPEVRTILGIAESAPPKPKRGVRTRVPNISRTPGPAAPESWLKRPTWTPLLALRGGRRRLNGTSGTTDQDRSRPSQLLRFARLAKLDIEGVSGKPPSLLHLALQTAAQQWDLVDEEDLPAIAELPLRLRLLLLSYLGYFGPTIDLPVLQALTEGSEAVKWLDLAGLAGSGALTLHRLVKYLRHQSPKAVSILGEEAVVDCWDQDQSLETALITHLPASRFSQLTHLSLSHPPPSGSSWRDLLSLAKYIPSVTHLSLAYWSRPTLTPNLATATVSSRHSPDVSAGGSHYYSGLDKDLSEPASILRQLSNSLLYLQWLDLEGCTEWVPALAFRGDPHDIGQHPQFDVDDVWSKTPAVTSIFAHNWKNLKYLNCSQGWFPAVSALRALPRQTMSVVHRRIVEAFLRNIDEYDLWKTDLDEIDLYDVEKRKADIWLQLEDRAMAADRHIHETRRAHACSYVTIDHGWERRIAEPVSIHWH